MSDGAEDSEREELLKQIAELDEKIKRKVLEIVSHPNCPEIFKNHPVVKEVVE